MKWILGLLLALANSVAWGQPTPHTKVALDVSDVAAKPGSTVIAAVHMKMDEGWHTYWKNPGDSGKATKITWTLPAGVTAGEIEWPVPEKLEDAGLITYIFKGETALIVPLTIAPNAAAGTATIKAKVSWLECEKECIPQNTTVQATLQIGSESKASSEQAQIKDWQAKIPKAGGDGLTLTAQWDGPAKGDERPIIFAINKPSGAWDFYNFPVEDFDLSPKTESLPPVDGKVLFRKVAKKYGADWPKDLSGLALLPGDDKTARIVKVALAETGLASTSAPAVNGSSKVAGAAAATPRATAIAQPTFVGVLALAFLGGLILNIMPCVLPVIALKVLGFVRQANEDPRRVRQLGLVYALGVIASFLGLAAFVILVKQAGRAASWGMQFQNPQFLVFITILVTLVAMNLFGVFEVTLGGGALTSAGELASREGVSGAFFNGVLATALATPCTAPFLGFALGFAFASTASVIIAVFLSAGLGLAAPYVVLCWFPAWLKKLPKPGAWMEKFKIAMGFPMLATAIWLFSLASARFGKSGALYLGFFLVILGFAAWLFGEFVQRGSKRRGLAGAFAIALVAIGFVYCLEAQLNWRHPVRLANSGGVVAEPGGIAWQPWTPDAVQAARAQGKPVIVDFTADWCLTCQVNKKTSIEIPSVREKIKSLGAIALLADNTDENPAITAELAKYKRAGVPLVVVFPADPKAEAIVLPEVLRPGLVLDALDKAAATRPVASAK
jgi:thiol:disulfide interchange protein DsbD